MLFWDMVSEPDLAHGRTGPQERLGTQWHGQSLLDTLRTGSEDD